ncbi:hypothetical protein TNIN_265011 [Trichonephila inaurata madagascariensis]|uniref:Uncharacterized protein n=1 Tax=Trichonephila inaurata madagascariensis TaxID=2747483 RepID=A0A8X7BSE8_9ARAC|nr:hypothetical protein TNIN_265011 [Trichonephila inaurata madagascariensis]
MSIAGKEAKPTGGPKNYTYKLSDGSEVCKIRGFNLNFWNRSVLNYELVKELFSSRDTTGFTTVTNPRKIAKSKIKWIQKLIKWCTIRVIQKEFSSLPYGY